MSSRAVAVPLPTLGDPAVRDRIHELERLAVSQMSTRPFLERADRVTRALAASFEGVYGRRALAQLLALKVVNLVVARHHFHHRHTRLASRPIQLMIDPANNCHLACPGCLHSANPDYARAYEWPGGLMTEATMDRLLAHEGCLAWGAVLYNWGEPLLNKRTPALISAAKRFLLTTSVSTNLSVPFDAEALVESGLNFLILSIDGATQATYEIFRRGGELELCRENIRRLVEARRRLRSPTPFLLWRYLSFEHNLHEVDDAMRQAEALGVDQFSVTMPFGVEWDDPAIRAARSPREGTHLLRGNATFRGPQDEVRTAVLDEEAVATEFERRWQERLPDGAPDEPSRATAATCRWLYQNLTLDARARLFPCCMAPEIGAHKVYGQYRPGALGAVNAPDFEASRLAFADRPAFERERRASAVAEPPPYCASCTETPELSYTLERDVRRDLRLVDVDRVLDDATIGRLTQWPESRAIPQ